MIYLTCIIAYLVLLGGIAIWKSREVHDQSDFAVAGRSLSPWMMVCTMLAVWIGTGSILGNAEQTYDTGMAAMLLPVGTFAGMALLSLIATRARNIEASTVPEIIEGRFGPVSRNLAMLSVSRTSLSAPPVAVPLGCPASTSSGIPPWEVLWGPFFFIVTVLKPLLVAPLVVRNLGTVYGT